MSEGSVEGGAGGDRAVCSANTRPTRLNFFPESRYNRGCSAGTLLRSRDGVATGERTSDESCNAS